MQGPAASVPEGDRGVTSLAFVVTRTGDVTTAASVRVAVEGADASDFADGILPSGTIEFRPGQDSTTFTVGVVGDTTAEADESITVQLSNPTSATILQASATATIRNDDAEINLRTIGGAGAFNRLTPNAWREAWLPEGVLISHRRNGNDATETWQAANFDRLRPEAYGGSDLADGDLGVAGRAGGSQTAAQEIDGSEAVRFEFTQGGVSVLDFGFSRFDPGDVARIDTFDAAGALLRSATSSVAGVRWDGLSEATSTIVRAEAGSFSIDKLSFG